MKAKILSLVAGLALAGAALVVPATPASAHHFDSASGYVCAAHRPANTVMLHSWPDAMGPGWVRYWCRAGVIYGEDWQYWTYWNQNTGTTWRPWAYQLCYPNPGWVASCGTAGH